MQIAVSEAKAKLTDLVSRAEAGEDMVLTRHGHPTVRLTPVTAVSDLQEQRRRALDRFSGSLKASPRFEGGAARAADFLYDERGRPA